MQTKYMQCKQYSFDRYAMAQQAGEEKKKQEERERIRKNNRALRERLRAEIGR